jgi:predicted ester cyclase
MTEADTSAANKAIVRRWFDEVWNRGREETIDELFAPHGIGYGLGDTDVPTRGPAEFKLFANNLRGAIADIHMTIEDIMAEGDKVTVRITVEGTHTGSQLGVAPTGRRIRIAGVVMVRIANGQIVEGWNSWDQLGLLRQIGALPAANTPDRFTSAKA